MLVLFVEPACASGQRETDTTGSDQTESTTQENDSSVASGPEGVAVLERGPDHETGLRFLPPNAIPFFRGEYVDQFWTIEVSYIETEIFLSDRWIPGRCGSAKVLLIKEGELVRYFYDSDQDWSVFFSFSAQYDKGCAFIARFLQRLRFFQSAAGEPGIVPLPAVVEIAS